MNDWTNKILQELAQTDFATNVKNSKDKDNNANIP
jgi:hypothetical protein